MKTPPFSLALVTGASSGIGQALARHLASEGIPLIAAGRNARALEDLKQALQSQVEVEIFKGELAESTERERLLSLIRERAPDLIINNAGFGLYGDAIDLPNAEQAAMVEVNVTALMEIAIEGARVLRNRGKPGVILNVSSAIGFVPGPGFSVYGATKAFVNSFSQGLNHELERHNIRVLAACPGVVQTQFSVRASKGKSQPKPDALTVPLDRVVHTIWNQILSGQPVRIIDWRYRLLIALSRILPSRLVGRSFYGSIKAKRLAS